MSKKIIKLINNERRVAKVKAGKACSSISYDICNVDGYDVATCAAYSYDKCGKDYSRCANGTDDICTYIDGGTTCSTVTIGDYCSYDYT